MIKNKTIYILIVISGIMTVAWELSRKDLKEVSEEKSFQGPDTYVPEGYVLVPIEVENADALSAILGRFGVVDIFLPALDPAKRAQLIASQVKILRAPLNPNKFAILVPSSESSRLVRVNSPVFVTIHNPKRQGTTFAKEHAKSSRIVFE